MVSPPAKSSPPPVPHVLLVCKPIAHCTHSRAQAPLALFTSGWPYHEQVKYHIPTAKATRPAEEPLAFASLCETYHMKPAEVDAFAFLCEALTLEDRPGLSALLVLDPATGKFLEHRRLCQDPRYKATWDTSYANELATGGKNWDQSQFKVLCPCFCFVCRNQYVLTFQHPAHHHIHAINLAISGSCRP